MLRYFDSRSPFTPGMLNAAVGGGFVFSAGAALVLALTGSPTVTREAPANGPTTAPGRHGGDRAEAPPRGGMTRARAAAAPTARVRE